MKTKEAQKYPISVWHGATTMINVTDVLTGSDISFAHLNEADALTVVKAGVNSAGTALHSR